MPQGILHVARKHHRGQVPGIVSRVVERETVGSEKPQVKGNVVADDWVRLDEVLQFTGDSGERRRALYLPRCDARQPLNEFGYGAARVDKAPEGVEHPFTLELDGAHLYDGVPVGVQSRGL